MSSGRHPDVPVCTPLEPPAGCGYNESWPAARLPGGTIPTNAPRDNPGQGGTHADSPANIPDARRFMTMTSPQRQPRLPGLEHSAAAPDSEGTRTSSPDQQALALKAIEPLLCRTQTPPPESLEGRTVWVVDAHSLIHQLFHAMPDMTSPRGEPVGAVFGLARDLLDLLTGQRPDYFFCAFDLPGKTFRHQLYDQYKINRPEMHEDLVPQMPLVYRLVAALGIPALGCESYEADDILATVARIVDERGGRCLLVTTDKDCRQLLTRRVSLYNLRKGELFDIEALRREWGIEPEQVVDFQALVGDSTDNVPGVPLIGPKLASQLLQKYGTLENVLDHADEVSGTKRRENLKRFRDQALLSRQLVELARDVPVAIDWQAGRLRTIDRRAAMELFHELGFRSLLSKLEQLSAQLSGAAAPQVERTAWQWHVVDTPEKLERFLDRLRRQKRISLDTETTDIRPRWAELVGLSFAWEPDEGWYLPVRAPQAEICLELQQTLSALREVLEDPQVEKVGQNLKYDMVVLRAAGVRLAGVRFDTMVASYLLEAGQRNHNLDELARRYLGHETIKIKELIGRGKKQRRMDEVPVQRVAEYACEDAILPLRLHPILAEKLQQAGLEKLFVELEMPLVEVLADLEYQGIRVDVECLQRLSRRYGERLAELEAEIYQLAGRPFNIASPRQLQEVLFQQLKLPVIKRTAKTGPSTDAAVLEQLAKEQSSDRTRACFVPSGRGCHRPTVQQRSQPPEHPGAHARRTRNPRCVRARRARLAVALGRLLADRTAHPGPFFRRRATLRGLCPRRRHPRPRGRRSGRSVARSGHARNAPGRQGSQLRSDLRPESLRTGPGAGDRQRRGRPVHRQLFRPLYAHRRVLAARVGRLPPKRLRDHHPGPAPGHPPPKRLRDHHPGPAPGHPRSASPCRAPAQSGRAHRGQHRDPGVGRGPDQTGHGGRASAHSPRDSPGTHVAPDSRRADL